MNEEGWYNRVRHALWNQDQCDCGGMSGGKWMRGGCIPVMPAIRSPVSQVKSGDPVSDSAGVGERKRSTVSPDPSQDGEQTPEVSDCL